MKRINTRVALILALLAAIGGGSFLFEVPQAEAACVPNPDVICPAIYAPVICNDGQVYSNDCYARANCARGCRPYGEVAI